MWLICLCIAPLSVARCTVLLSKMRMYSFQSKSKQQCTMTHIHVHIYSVTRAFPCSIVEMSRLYTTCIMNIGLEYIHHCIIRFQRFAVNWGYTLKIPCSPPSPVDNWSPYTDSGLLDITLSSQLPCRMAPALPMVAVQAVIYSLLCVCVSAYSIALTI